MLRTDDLVALPDFRLGGLTVSPSRRIVETDEQSLAVEPRVMQVLVLLSREAGQVVPRQRLFEELWGGVPVGDDSLNRAIAGARKALGLDPGPTLETIPRTGYRLKVEGQSGGQEQGISRRKFTAAAAAGAAVAAIGGGTWLYRRHESDQAFSEAMDKGRDALAYSDAIPQRHGSFSAPLRSAPTTPLRLACLRTAWPFALTALCIPTPRQVYARRNEPS